MTTVKNIAGILTEKPKWYLNEKKKELIWFFNTDKPRNIIIFIILSFVVSRVFMYMVYNLTTFDFDLMNCIRNYNTWDAEWYWKYAMGIYHGDLKSIIGMNGQRPWAFFPLYPLLVSISCFASGGNSDICLIFGSALSSVLFMSAEFMGYKYIMLTRKNLRMAYYYIFFMSFGIYSFYFSVLYTESLFLLLLTLCFYFLKTENYIKMGICGALLSATRTTGIMFVFVVLVYLISEQVRKEKKFNIKDFVVSNLGNSKLIFGTFLIPAGLFSYILFLKYYLGDGFAFMHVTTRAWGRENVGVLTNLKLDLVDVFPPTYEGVFFILVIILVLYTLINNRRADEAVIPLITVFAAGSSSLLSAPRYFMGSLTVVLAFLDEYCKMSRFMKAVILMAALILERVLLREWINANILLI